MNVVNVLLQGYKAKIVTLLANKIFRYDGWTGKFNYEVVLPCIQQLSSNALLVSSNQQTLIVGLKFLLVVAA